MSNATLRPLRLGLMSLFLASSLATMPRTALGGFLGADFLSTSTLYDVNVATGAASNPRVTNLGQIIGLEYVPDTNTVLAMRAGSGNLFSVDPTTGVANVIGDTRIVNSLEGDLAFDPTTGRLFVIDSVIGGFDLYSLNPATASAAIVGRISTNSSADLSGLAVDGAGNLYALDTGNEVLLAIDKTNAGILGAISTSVSLGAIAGMDFDASGALYVADGGALGTNTLYTVNVSSGVFTSVGNLGLPNGLSGLTFVPEPSAVLLFGIGASGLLGHGLRRRLRIS